MAVNAELLENYANRQTLRDELKRLQDEIAPTVARIKDIETRLSKVSGITDVLDGVCLQVLRDREGRWSDVRSVEVPGGWLSRHAALKQRPGSEYWMVFVDKGNPIDHEYAGGRTLGMLPHNLSYEQVYALACRWLQGDETILDTTDYTV